MAFSKLSLSSLLKLPNIKQMIFMFYLNYLAGNQDGTFLFHVHVLLLESMHGSSSFMLYNLLASMYCEASG